MKLYFTTTVFLLFISFVSFGQFEEKSFLDFRQTVKDLDFQELKDLNAIPNQHYYKGYDHTPQPNEILYLDTIVNKLGLTQSELDLLTENHFFVTSRLDKYSFGEAYRYIYVKDLPVFVSTDLILHALHTSYDLILKGSEKSMMNQNLQEYIADLYNNVPLIANKYSNSLSVNVADVDLYLTVTQSLIQNSRLQTRYADQENYDQIMDAIDAEQLTKVQLFTNKERSREIDFSQFKPRGHYVFGPWEEDNVSLEPYFKAMMWLGRIDFPLTSPPTGVMEPEWTFDEIQRMNISAYILNEMMQTSQKKDLLEQNNEIINFLVGESDNLNSDEYSKYLQSKGITNATQLKDSLTYADYQDGLSTNPDFEQKYTGAFYYVDPYADKPDVLPISFMVSGQRFIIDSYILDNVVFDRIIYKGEKVKRMMPDPLDVLYTLGNNDALYFLEDELKTYPYESQLASMRYLIEQKEPEFWNESLYNSWLSSIRALNPGPDNDNMPFFMRTGAWHQQKMNTQLAAWTQVRHDNLLYAKPSYSGGGGCSFPYSYVEPYPEFYHRLGEYATEAASFFSGKSIQIDYSWPLDSYFENFATIMSKLEVLAQKELNNQAFDENEISWLKQMLIGENDYCGDPLTGWFIYLFLSPEKRNSSDYVNVDIHTQPTDEDGNIVGKVLHMGLGNINMGVCLAKIPGTNTTVAYTGAFMSYYENITDNFQRLNDEEWGAKVESGNLPDRPVWANSYLADQSGNLILEQKSLPTTMLVNNQQLKIDESLWVKVFPNPASNIINIQMSGSDQYKVKYLISDICGRILRSGLITSSQSSINISSFPGGIYMMKFIDGTMSQFVKVVKE